MATLDSKRPFTFHFNEDACRPVGYWTSNSTILEWKAFIAGLEVLNFGLYLVPPLTLEHRNRVEWYREWFQWNIEWDPVVFSDEFRFCLGMHDD
ncbi:hypothetical protein ABEB36_007578 [Hypothenemus hampei]|uniref:Uncharacterized protein n=1 Tax=Hypothenemus hampei TaxID=57062 RepID=A0ABD1EWX8_HYPHA